MISTPRSARGITNLPTPATIVLALVLSVLTSSVLYLISNSQHINNTTIALIYLLSVGFSATFWGLSAGITAAITSFLTFNFLFIPEQYTLQVKETEDLIILVAFLVVAVVISELVGRVRENLNLAKRREFEALRLFELSTMLAKLADAQNIAQTLSQKVLETLGAQRVETLIEAEPTVIAQTNLTGHLISTRPSAIIPIESMRNLAGEIRIWREKPITAEEERLLKVFASQGVLAIERVRLAGAAHKAGVLEESDRLKSSLLSSVSHELRSPLAAIKASVSSLRAGEVDWQSAARQDLLETVEEEIDHLNVLVGNLLDMSRIEAGVLQPQKKPNMLGEIVSAVTARMKQQLQSYHLVVEIAEELPMVNVDYVQMEQVFTNLLSNSMKYSPPGSTIRVAARFKDNHFVEVSISNQSIPIPEADLERIFDKFYRINPSERVTGSGLGLSICKGIIEAHGGRIWAKNLSDGLVFNFTLPIS